MDRGSDRAMPGREPSRVRRARDLHLNILLLAQRALDDLEAICRVHGVTHAQYVALWTLCLADDPSAGVPVGAVADGRLNRASDATRLVDRLVRAGLAEKVRNPSDGRGVLVRATAEGRRRFEAITPEIQRYHATQFASLSSAEVDEFARLAGTAVWSPVERPDT
jgi:DNA-binding MarR family transcriptional regulator